MINNKLIKLINNYKLKLIRVIKIHKSKLKLKIKRPKLTTLLKQILNLPNMNLVRKIK